MNRIEQCLSQIRKIRAVGSGHDAAYVARSRIGRLILSLGRLVAEYTGGESLDRPTAIIAGPNIPAGMARIVSASNRVLVISKSITQPSEPLDERWRAGWRELQHELLLLEKQLSLLGTSVASANKVADEEPVRHQ